jgi:hypothetical protein
MIVKPNRPVGLIHEEQQMMKAAVPRVAEDL